MAIVRDLSGPSLPKVGGVDRPLTSPNRRVTSTPVNALTPQYAGEIVEFYDSVTGLTYQFRASGLTNKTWVRASDEV